MTKTVRQQDSIANLNAFVVDLVAYGTDDTSSFVAKDCGWVAQPRKQVRLPDELLSDVDGERCGLCNGAILTVWQIPEYFISIRNSSSRISSRMIGVNLNGPFGSSTTKASVSMFVVVGMTVRMADKESERL